MTYATKQLTESLQELTSQTQTKGSFTRNAPKTIAKESFHLSLEVQTFLDTRRDHSERSRTVNEGRY